MAIRLVAGQSRSWEVAGVSLVSTGLLRRRRTGRLTGWEVLNDLNLFDVSPMALQVSELRDMHPADAATHMAGLTQEAEDLAAAAAFRAERCAIQGAQTERLAQRLPIGQIRLPFLFRSEIGAPEIEMLADAFTDGLAPL